MTIGERITEIQKNSGMSKVAFADKVGISKQTLYKYEKGIVINIPYSVVEKIAEIGNVSPAYIVGWDT